jgi:hypothetical protein
LLLQTSDGLVVSSFFFFFSSLFTDFNLCVASDFGWFGWFPLLGVGQDNLFF